MNELGASGDAQSPVINDYQAYLVFTGETRIFFCICLADSSASSVSLREDGREIDDVTTR